MARHSAGILLYRKAVASYEVLLVHPGGPFWAKKDLGAWSMPKGEFGEGEEPLAAAKREFEEEVGAAAPAGEYQPLGEFVQPDMKWRGFKMPGGKIVYPFVLESDFNLEVFHSNMFEMEWPPKSGQRQEFPENDRAAWVPLGLARQKVVKGQVPVIESLAAQLGEDLADDDPAPQTTLF